MSVVREGLGVRLEGVQGHLDVGATEDSDGKTVWFSIVGPGDDDDGPSVGVNPIDLRDAISFVLGEGTRSTLPPLGRVPFLPTHDHPERVPCGELCAVAQWKRYQDDHLQEHP